MRKDGILEIEMKELINKIFNDLEAENNIKVLFSMESGSREYGFASIDSDYDIRFVYIRPIKDYFNIGSKYDDEIRKRIDEKETILDFVGFDLNKFLNLLCNSNPTVIEWLNSTTWYRGLVPWTLQYYASNNISLFRLFKHYNSLAKSNYEKYLKSGRKQTLKKYLYVVRALISARYIEIFRTIPPLNYFEILEKLKLNGCFDLNYYQEFYALGIIKSISSEEKKEIVVTDFYNKWIEEQLKFEFRFDSMEEKKYSNELLLNEYLWNKLYENCKKREKGEVEQKNKQD